jgi:hypothetical protein
MVSPSLRTPDAGGEIIPQTAREANFATDPFGVLAWVIDDEALFSD